MKLRTSFFNGTVLLKDITRFCPIWIIYTVFSLMTCFSLITINLFDPEQLAYTVAQTVKPLAFCNLIYAFVCASFLFGDLFKSRLCNALHALPIRREGWFFTHTLAGLLFFLIPNIIIAAVIMPLMGKTFFIAGLWLLATTAQYLFFFALAVVCVTLTGSRFAASAVYLILNFLSMLCYWFVDTYYAPLLPGLHIRSDLFELFCPVVEISGSEFFRFNEIYYTTNQYDMEMEMLRYEYAGLTGSWWYLLVIGLLSLPLLGLGLTLYRKRKLEAAGDFLAFRKPMPVFLIFFTLAIGAIFQTIFGLFSSNVISMLIGLAVGCYAGQMLLRRTVRVFDKGSLIWCGSIVGVLALTLLLTFIDPLGLTRWKPAPEQVTSITLSENYYYSSEEEALYSYTDSMNITNPGQIEELIAVHEELIRSHAIADELILGIFSEEVHTVHLTYHMSSGAKVERRYYYTDSHTHSKLTKFYSSPEYVMKYEDWDEYVGSVLNVYLDEGAIPQSEILSLLEAIKADCEAGTMDQSKGWDEYGEGIQIETSDQYVYLYIYNNCENTKNWLKAYRSNG